MSVLPSVRRGVGLVARRLLAAASLGIVLSACGGAPAEDSAPVQPGPSTSGGSSTLTPTASSASARACPPESPFAVTRIAQPIRTVLRESGYQPNGEVAHIGGVTIATGLTLNSADGHEQNAFFIANGHSVATDLTGPGQTYHFAVDICQVTTTQVVTAYLVNAGPMGHAPGCPPVRTARVRWRVHGRRVTRLDPLPQPPCG